MSLPWLFLLNLTPVTHLPLRKLIKTGCEYYMWGIVADEKAIEVVISLSAGRVFPMIKSRKKQFPSCDIHGPGWMTALKNAGPLTS
jgi:hypothetical protein